MDPLITGGRAQTKTIMPSRNDPPGVPDHTATATANPPTMPIAVTTTTKTSVFATTLREVGVGAQAPSSCRDP